MRRTIPNVSLTYFVEFVAKSGTPKLTVVEQFTSRGKYDPQTDFYKGFRETLVEALERGARPKALVAWAQSVHTKKREAYGAALAGFSKWLGRKTFTWFEPPAENFTVGPLTLNVNPELGLEIDGERFVVKMYLKEEPLKRNRAEIILHLMHEALDGVESDGVQLGVLDVRAGKLFVGTPKARHMDALLLGEATSFVAMFQSITEAA